MAIALTTENTWALTSNMKFAAGVHGNRTVVCCGKIIVQEARSYTEAHTLAQEWHDVRAVLTHINSRGPGFEEALRRMQFEAKCG